MATAAILAGLLAGCGKGEGTAQWDDPAGDVKPPSNLPDKPVLDVVRVEARGADGALHLRVRLKDSLEKFFAYTYPDGKKGGGHVAHFFIDADNNPETGGHPSWAREASRPLKGYEFEVLLQLGYRFSDGGPSSGRIAGDMTVDPSKYKQIEPFAVYGVMKIRQGSDSYDFQNFRLPPESRDAAYKATRWKGDTVETSIPYAWLGLKAGDTIRLCFKEREMGGASGKGFSEDRQIRLN